MAETGKCIICGRSTINSTQKASCEARKMKNKTSKILSNWKEECAKTLCKILLGSKSHLYLKYLQQHEQYCSLCEQTMRDIHFTQKQIKSMQRRLEKLSTIMRKRLHENYLTIEQAIQITNAANTASKGEENTKIETDDYKSRNNSYNEQVSLLYKAASQICKMAWTMSNDLLSAEEKPKNSNVPSEMSEDGNNFPSLAPQMKIEVEDTLYEDYENVLDNKSNDNHNQEGLINENPTRRTTRKSALVAQLKLEESNDSPAEESSAYCDNDNDSDPDTFPTEGNEDAISDSEKNPSRNKKFGKAKKKVAGERKLDREEILMARRARKRENGRRYREKYGRKDYVIKRTIKCSEENCSSMFKTEESMQIHFAEVHSGEERPFECFKCSKRFKKHYILKGHIRDLHSGSRSYDHFCKFCGKGYALESELEFHYSESHLGPNPFSCAFCSTVCSNGIDLGIHMKSAHPEGDRPKCDVCGKHFATQQSLKIHARLHGDPDSLFKCTMCDHKTATPAQLRIHMERHDKTKKYTCEQCGKGFNHLYSLKSHAEFHSEEKKYKCKICDKGFVKSKDCQRHEIAHTGIREYVCTTCGRSFANKYSFNDHEKIHLRERGIDVFIRSKKRKTETLA